MQLHELKTLLRSHDGGLFRLQLPGGSSVPASFHVTEVGRIQKTFIDCGGTLRESFTCQLQVWVGEDGDHRLESKKMAAILEKAKSFLPDDSVPVEVEYEDQVISQYTIESHNDQNGAIVLHLAHKHTDCLAKELCGLPAPLVEDTNTEAASCCSGKGCC